MIEKSPKAPSRQTWQTPTITSIELAQTRNGGGSPIDGGKNAGKNL
jgi:hypothetical protein